MFASPHTMPESHLTASTLSSLIDRAKYLQRTHFACTDHGFLYSGLKTYNDCKKAKIKPILGIQLYFKDPLCSIIAGTKADRCKYFSVTLYAEDQEAYQAICKLISRTDFPTIKIGEEIQSILSWTDLEYLSKFSINLVLGGIHCLVGKTYLSSDSNVASDVFEKLNSLYKDRIRVALICQEWIKKFANVIEIKYLDGTLDSILGSSQVTTDRARRIDASDLVERSGHAILKSKIVDGIYTEVDKGIDYVKLHTGFLPLQYDVILKINKFLMLVAEKYNIPIMVSDYAYYSTKESKIVQRLVLEGKNSIHADQHMRSEEEVVSYLQKTMLLDKKQIEKILSNNMQWASLFDNFELKYEWRLASIGTQEPLKKALEIIKRNGRMKWDNPIYVERLKMELGVISKNGIKDLVPYFLPIVEILDRYKEKKHINSPGRGSAGSSLFCYLLGITNLDPIVWDLPFNRFFSKTRIEMKKLPDIDTDLPQKETLMGKDGHSGFLYERWGNCAGHISTRHTVRLRSAIKDADRYFNGKVSQETERFVSSLPDSPQGVSDKHFIFGYENDEGEHIPGILETNSDLQNFTEKHPKIWDVVSKAMGITRAFSKHACAHVLSDIPLDEVTPLKEGYITHYEHKEVESNGLVKYDFLTISQLLDIEVCLELINKKNEHNFEPGYFFHNGIKTYIWDLPTEEKVYQSIHNGNTVSLFQISSRGMSDLVKEMLPNSMRHISAVLALERPGPKDYEDPVTGLNMVEEYLLRRKGESQPDIKELAEILPESYGTLIYQEDLGKVAKQLAGFSDEDAEILRENMAKKKMVELTKIKPIFIEGAKKKVSLEVAEKIWEQMVTFGRYGFSIIHSTEYAMITYACMFLRHNYPLAWWSAVLTNAEEKEITGKFYPHVKHLLASPDVNISGNMMEPDYANNKIRSKLSVIRGMGDKTIDPIISARPYKNIQDFVDKDVAGPTLAHKLILVGILDSLFKPNMSLEEKLKSYEDAVEIKKFKEKKAKADLDGKKMRANQPKEGIIPSQYVNIHPLQLAALKKQVLPTLPVDLHELGSKYSKALDKSASKPKVIDPIWESSIFLIDGPIVERLDKLEAHQVEKDMYFASFCYVIESKEFSYAKGTKKALKLTVDCGGGYICEKVLWPDYNTQELIYPKELAKGKMVTLFLRKKKDRGGIMNITNIVIET